MREAGAADRREIRFTDSYAVSWRVSGLFVPSYLIPRLRFLWSDARIGLVMARRQRLRRHTSGSRPAYTIRGSATWSGDQAGASIVGFARGRSPSRGDTST